MGSRNRTFEMSGSEDMEGSVFTMTEMLDVQDSKYVTET